jgi:hypothetical protein
VEAVLYVGRAQGGLGVKDFHIQVGKIVKPAVTAVDGPGLWALLACG